ncbi:MAG: hypothetical protein JWO68_3061 [Actinomycetia bacterium]|nr:hypothetical protein [Actinomycetes bacterium]
MRNHVLAALGSKVAVGAAVTVLAFGTAGAVLALQPVSDSSPSERGGPFVVADETTTTSTTTSTTVAPTTTTTVAPTTSTTLDDHGNDNFGAIVSKDAHDGGVDGQDISEAAHERNDERKAEHDAEVNDDHGDDGPNHDVNDDHGGDHGQDD